MDFKELLAHLWLEINSKSGSTTNTMKRNGVCAFFSRQYPDVIKDIKPREKPKKGPKGKVPSCDGSARCRSASRDSQKSKNSSGSRRLSRASSHGSKKSNGSARVSFAGNKAGKDKSKGKGKGRGGKRSKTPKPSPKK